MTVGFGIERKNGPTFSGRFCYDERTMAAGNSIFIFGATGFVGRNLMPALAGRSYETICLVRDARGRDFVRQYGAEAVVGDVLQPGSYRAALQPGSTAVYLIHAMGPQAVRGDFAGLDRRAAQAMLDAGHAAGASRIIHLSGLYDPRERLSRHLASRAEVAAMIAASAIPATILRAAMIFGSGSASYEILKAALSLAVVPLPPWRETRVQPIAISDVIRCVVTTIERQDLTGRTLEIGGPEIFTYGRLLRRFAEARGLRKIFSNIPFEGRWLAARILSKRSGVALGETYTLLESLNNTSVVSGENAIQSVFNFRPTPIFEII